MSVVVGEQTTPIDKIGTGRATRRGGLGKGIDSLAASMAVEGVRHPVLIMPSGDVLDGQRRIVAARHLGWTTIPARQVTTIEDAAEALLDARDEHTMTRSIEEWVDQGLMLETLDHRDKGVHRDYAQNIIGPAVSPSGSAYKRARAVVRASRSQIRPRHVVDTARAAVRAIDAGTLTISGAYARIAIAAKTEPPVEDTVDDRLPSIPPPSPQARSPKARVLRIQWIRALAAEGATTPQIAEKIGIGASAIRKIYRDINLVNKADSALAKTQSKAIDPNRSIRVIIDDLDALVWSLEGVDINGLDKAETQAWARSLAQYARAISRASRKIKGAS